MQQILPDVASLLKERVTAVDILNVITADGLVHDDTFVLKLSFAEFDGTSDKRGASATLTLISLLMICNHRGVYHGVHSSVGSLTHLVSSLVFFLFWIVTLLLLVCSRIYLEGYSLFNYE